MTRKIASTNWFPETEVVAPLVAVVPGLAPEVASADPALTVTEEPATPATESKASAPPAAPPDLVSTPGTTGKKARPPKAKAERRSRPRRETRARPTGAAPAKPAPTKSRAKKVDAASFRAKKVEAAPFRATKVEAASRPRSMRAERRRVRKTWRKVVSLALFAVVVGAWFVTLRPTTLGGPASVLTVRGVSMEPTYQYGDIIIAHERSDYRPGDIIAFRVPEGEVGAGAVVIHRVIGGDAATGFITQGDNNPDPDEWRPVPTDILGSARWRIPALGRLMAGLRTGPGIAIVAGALAALIVIFGSESPRQARADSRRLHPESPDEAQPETTLAAPAMTAELHSDVAADREAPEFAPDPQPIDPPHADPTPVEVADSDPLDDLIVPPPLLPIASPEPVALESAPHLSSEAATDPMADGEGSEDDILWMDLHLGPRRRPPTPEADEDDPSVVGEYWGDLGYLAALLRPTQEPVLFDDDLEAVASRPLRRASGTPYTASSRPPSG